MPQDKTGMSRTIECLRLPMTALVVFIHYCPAITTSPASAGEWAFNIMAFTLSRVLADAAVPTFFFISGFLFFYGTQHWGWEIYTCKIKKRVRTLLVPYILWNVLAVALWGTARYASCRLSGLPWSEFTDYIDTNMSLHMLWDANRIAAPNWMFGLYASPDHVYPSLVAFWFVRNLIVLSLLTPILYPLIKRWGKMTLTALFACYVTGLWIHYTPLDITGFFFFSFGAYFSIHGRNFVTAFTRHKHWLYIATMLLFAVCLVSRIMNHDAAKAASSPLFITACVMSAICVSDGIVRHGRDRAVICFAKYSFFIYSAHCVLILSACKALSEKVLSTLHVFPPIGVQIASYILAPLMAIATCILIFHLMKRFTPRMLALLTGGRNF